MPQDIKILLADDHKIMREGLRTLIENQAGMKVIAEAGSGQEAVQMAIKLQPDIVVMDINMPILNGIEATRQIITTAPAVRVICLSMYSEKKFIVEMLKAGASGYLLKECAVEELIIAINSVSQHTTYLSPGLVEDLLKDYVKIVSEDEFMSSPALTAREREVLHLIAEGSSTKDIALSLNVSVKTIETHRRQIMDKLGLNSVAALTKYAIREGLSFL